MTARHSTPLGDADALRDRLAHAAPTIVVDPEAVMRKARRRRALVRVGTTAGVFVVMLVAVLVMRPLGGSQGPAAMVSPPPEPSRPVEIQVVPGRVSPGDVVTVVLQANADNGLTFGVAAELDRWDGEQWRPVGEVGLCLVDWGCIGKATSRLEAVAAIGLGAVPGQPGPSTLMTTDGLSDGWYRVTQHAALGEGVATGVFEIRAGSNAAPPPPPADEVRLSVEPALVSPDGGLVRVATLVPSGPDGTLTAQDIEKADASLASSALVQRWDGQKWLDVVEVSVEPRGTDLGAEWGSLLTLPPLEEGSYRLVRERAGEPSAWGLFAVISGVSAPE